MKYILYLLIINGVFQLTKGQCAGGIWPIQDSTIGSFSVSWRYNMASNTVQFIIQGQAIASINLASTYIAIGWSDIEPTMNNMDVAMFFPGTQIVQDRYSRGHVVPPVDTQQDFCVIRTNITDRNVYAAFERFITTGDTNDTSFTSNLYLMFAMGLYTSNSTNNFYPQRHFFRIPNQSTINLTCISSGCLTTSCTIASCPCLQDVTTHSGQCVCFPPSSCVSGSTIVPRTTAPSLITTSITSTLQIPLVTTNASNTNLCQCVNGGTCLTNGSCLCTNRNRGKFCQLNNPCIDYCRNNGTCSVNCTDTLCGTPNCTCTNGYTGIQCATIADGTCQSNTCMYGTCIMISNRTSQCQCISGFLGTRCESIDSCLLNPCNQGTCIPSTNCQSLLCGHSCNCSNGTSGTNCEIGANPCLSSPCQNGGLCSVSSNTYACQCIAPYGGTNCQLIINVCTPNPCNNNGICTRTLSVLNGTYQCTCVNGYVGDRCDYLSGCASSPCRNNGQCLPLTNNCSSITCPFRCSCSSGTTGVYCEQIAASCLVVPCQNGGTCSLDSTTSIYYCRCPTNIVGTQCETIQSTCTNTTCSNRGVCYIDGSSGNNTARCICSTGYTGQYCQSILNVSNSCLLNPCGYNSTCISISNTSYYCICPNGLGGQSCSSNPITSCSDSPCHYLSQCQQITNTNPVSYQCICPDYLTGNRCQYTNYCQKQPCYNQGTCMPLGSQNNFMCSCPPGFGHYDCSKYLGLTCNANICLNGGTCDYNNGSVRCICPTGYAGASCEWASVCSTTTCLNGGTCRQTAATMAECLCATGFTGPICSLRDSCVNFPCKNGGACTNLGRDTGTSWSAYRCNCPTGFYGQNCDTQIASCSTMLCPSYKICSEQSTGAVCTCSGGKVGTFCQYDNPCSLSSSTLCANGGTCVSTNTDPPSASCLCPGGFTGSHCNVTRQSDPCASNPCQTNGYCALGLTNTTYSCICQVNYTGSQCERSNPCISSPCLNQAICQSYWNTTNTWFMCGCVGTFTGTRCETSLLNPCGGLCMNGSPCVNGVCVCPMQYTGTYCGLVNPCSNQICWNAGTCTVNANATNVSFKCSCSSLYTGQYCESSMYTQAQLAANCILPCVNGGSCSNGICVCTSQYIGPLCQYTNPCSNQSLCLNSGTCIGQYNGNGSLYTQCFCREGYTGTYCESTICSSTSCNGGVCTAAQNSFVCACPTGKVGDRCQYVDVCLSNPCLSTERCEQTGTQYQCNPCYDRSTFCSNYQNLTIYCDNRYTLIINNVSIPVPDACQRSCGKCVPIQRLKDINDDSYLVTEDNDDSDLVTEDNEEEFDTTESEMTSSSTTPTTTTTETTTTTTTTILGQNIIFSREEN